MVAHSAVGNLCRLPLADCLAQNRLAVQWLPSSIMTSHEPISAQQSEVLSSWVWAFHSFWWNERFFLGHPHSHVTFACDVVPFICFEENAHSKCARECGLSYLGYDCRSKHSSGCSKWNTENGDVRPPILLQPSFTSNHRLFWLWY